ncbi:hypothetical protein FB446DRAFT_796049 [Lentinula raphanica]|nr:hypothetical protein FB446DRAFT_796049 [Lentinula raphanica]
MQSSQLSRLSPLDDDDYEELSKPGISRDVHCTPASSDTPSLPSFHHDQAHIQTEFKGPQSNYKKAKDDALICNGYRCVVTGHAQYNNKAPTAAKDTVKAAWTVAGGVVNTHLVHIVLELISYPDSSTQREYAASVLAVLEKFSYDMDKINGNKVLSLFNVMTMEPNMHDWFNHLKLYFETMVHYGFMIWVDTY